MSTPHPKEVVVLCGRKIRESPKAVLFTFCAEGKSFADFETGNTQREWFPLSQVVSIHNTFNAETQSLDSMVVSNWICQQKGIAL